MPARLLMMAFLALFLPSAPAAAQYSFSAPSGFPTCEEPRSVSKPSSVAPRDLCGGYLGQYRARAYIPPGDVHASQPAALERRRPYGEDGGPVINIRSGGLKTSGASMRRHKADAILRENQRKIGERSRIAVPSLPPGHQIYGPGQSPALSPGRRLKTPVPSARNRLF